MIERLRELALKHPQRELAERLRVSQAYVSMLLAGRRPFGARLAKRIEALDRASATAHATAGEFDLTVIVESDAADVRACQQMADDLAGGR